MSTFRFFSNVDTSGRKLTAQKEVTFWTKSKQKYLSMTLTEISFFLLKAADMANLNIISNKSKFH